MRDTAHETDVALARNSLDCAKKLMAADDLNEQLRVTTLQLSARIAEQEEKEAKLTMRNGKLINMLNRTNDVLKSNGFLNICDDIDDLLEDEK